MFIKGCHCCGGCCSTEGVDTATQPDVNVTDGGCPCEIGSHDGAYAFSTSIVSGAGRIWFWSGFGTCETDDYGFPFLALLSISVECQPGGDWIVGASTYAFPGGSVYGIDGSAPTCNLSINGDGELVGTVNLDMYGDSDGDSVDELICTLTLTFGP